ncbi:hypothetical protein HWV62_39241 [Athelia sp. TMB]|nr:hypothetical protein HWV62_39241 [Athelia sp. TMB]
MSASPLQASIARQSMITGVAIMTLGMAYGTQIASETVGHPVLTLATHVQFMLNGMLPILASSVLNTPSICRMSRGALVLYAIALHSMWITLSSEVAGSYVGIAFPRLVKEAGLAAMDEGKFQLYSLAHYIPGALLMLAWASLLVHCIFPVDTSPDAPAVAAKEKSN